MNPPAWAEKYYLESDAIAVINIGKRHFRKLVKLKEIVRETLESGNEVVKLLD